MVSAMEYGIKFFEFVQLFGKNSIKEIMPDRIFHQSGKRSLAMRKQQKISPF